MLSPPAEPPSSGDAPPRPCSAHPASPFPPCWRPRPRGTPAGKPAGGITRTHALALLGEPALPADFPHWAWVNPDAPKGGEIVLAALGSFDSFNPLSCAARRRSASAAICDTLLRSSDDEPSTEYGHLAQRIDLPADQSGWPSSCAPAARWHDGRPMTAEDVVWTFDTLRTRAGPTTAPTTPTWRRWWRKARAASCSASGTTRTASWR